MSLATDVSRAGAPIAAYTFYILLITIIKIATNILFISINNFCLHFIESNVRDLLLLLYKMCVCKIEKLQTAVES